MLVTSVGDNLSPTDLPLHFLNVQITYSSISELFDNLFNKHRNNIYDGEIPGVFLLIINRTDFVLLIKV